jgi:stearoyl-CoA desaturase (delta-9 desaturase)
LAVPAVLEAVVIGLITTQVAFIVTTVYLHRSLAHRAVTLKAPVAFACRVVIWMATGTRPRQWVAVHRKHHAFTDKEGDPHSPKIFGFSAVQFGNAVLYRRVARKPDQVNRYARDLPADRWDTILFDHALLGLALGVGILIADNLATNNQWLALLVAGEGLHNNHHALTTSSRMAMAKGEIDPGWWAIRSLVALRLATVRQLTRTAVPAST